MKKNKTSQLSRLLGALGIFSISLSASAQTVGHWQFNGSDFLTDVSGSGNGLTVNSVGSVTQSNDAAVFDASGVLETSGNLIGASSAFTFEGFVNLSDISSLGRNVLGGERGTNSNRDWELYVEGNGSLVLELPPSASGGAFFVSSFDFVANNDYYFAIAVSAPSGGEIDVDFYFEDITAGGLRQTETITRTQAASNNSGLAFALGGRPGGTGFLNGSYDEARLSLGALSAGDLLVSPTSAIPEPSTYALLGGLACIAFVTVRRYKRS